MILLIDFWLDVNVHPAIKIWYNKIQKVSLAKLFNWLNDWLVIWELHLKLHEIFALIIDSPLDRFIERLVKDRRIEWLASFWELDLKHEILILKLVKGSTMGWLIELLVKATPD